MARIEIVSAHVHQAGETIPVILHRDVEHPWNDLVEYLGQGQKNAAQGPKASTEQSPATAPSA